MPPHFALFAETYSRDALFDDECQDTLGSGHSGAGHNDVAVRGACRGNELLDTVQNVVIVVANSDGVQADWVGAGSRCCVTVTRNESIAARHVAW